MVSVSIANFLHSEEDKTNFKYEAGPKNLAVIGFVSQDQIQREHLIGDGCMVFQPIENDEVSIHSNLILLIDFFLIKYN